ncbi:hypothetical protein LVY75_04760 (plasmid) [Sinorhizobium sp. B11]
MVNEVSAEEIFGVGRGKRWTSSNATILAASNRMVPMGTIGPDCSSAKTLSEKWFGFDVTPK